ncbi:hypothetical protein PILCRDRAFT_817235 [Piloderma croceum F 1598]|uniref:Uncharacterized protein n=1 Tax=Piloderma croceum (strain F 1598) TaxID=765440 RepID=A0A0C3BG25_PILCF|nr:hypothetical protein PILCRDRAFT_817235 [Piloderma croceum F 1598]
MGNSSLFGGGIERLGVRFWIVSRTYTIYEYLITFGFDVCLSKDNIKPWPSQHLDSYM